MKKIFLLVFICIFMAGCGSSSTQQATPKENTSIFKEVGYFKHVNNDRSFCVYTNSKDTKEMIAYAQKKAYTPKSQTVVHFFDDEKSTPNNTSIKDYDIAMWLTTLNKDAKTHILGTYQKLRSAKEVWYNKDDATNEGMSEKSIDIKQL